MFGDILNKAHFMSFFAIFPLFKSMLNLMLINIH